MGLRWGQLMGPVLEVSGAVDLEIRVSVLAADTRLVVARQVETLGAGVEARI